MKKFSLIVLIALWSANLLAQDVVNKSKGIDIHFTEKYQVLKSDKKIRHGSYKLYFNPNVPGKSRSVAAEGEYVNGKKSGVWTYYASGKIAQKYDYDKDSLLVDDKFPIRYQVDGMKEGDSVKAPLKIGGRIAGYVLLLSNINFREYMPTITNGMIKVNYWFYIDENGKLTNWEVKLENDEKGYIKDLKDVPEDHANFIPAILNGKKVPSLIIYEVNFRSEMVIMKQTLPHPR